jgi:L-fucose mutarotase
VVDANFPAASTAASTIWGEVIHLPALMVPETIDLITALMPLDAFTDACSWRMQIDDAPDEMGEVHNQTNQIITAAKPDDASLGNLERQDFYARAMDAFAVVATSDQRPYGCYILRKGVVF